MPPFPAYCSLRNAASRLFLAAIHSAALHYDHSVSNDLGATLHHNYFSPTVRSTVLHYDYVCQIIIVRHYVIIISYQLIAMQSRITIIFASRS